MIHFWVFPVGVQFTKLVIKKKTSKGKVKNFMV
jgi:hypothetical protein